MHGLENCADSDLCATCGPTRDWRADTHMIELPMFWSRRKSDATDESDVRLRVELMRILAYAAAANDRFGDGDRATWTKQRQRLIATYAELGMVADGQSIDLAPR